MRHIPLGRSTLHAVSAGALLHFVLPALPVAAADFKTGQPADMFLAPPFFRPFGVAVDPVTSKVFVNDGMNNRILRYSSADALQNSGAPEAVIGQADTFGSSPGTSATSLNQPFTIFVDHEGRLWVADAANRRVLRYDNASNLSTGAAASGVLGQPSFTTSASSLSRTGLDAPSGLTVDLTGTLWVTDPTAHRVLRWDAAATLPPGAPASGVLGQATFTSGSQNGVTASAFKFPMALAVEHSGSTPVRLWVADGGHFRVLGFNSPGAKTNGASADRVLGQTTFTSGDEPASTLRNKFKLPVALATQGTSLWVADDTRVLRFGDVGTKVPGADADAVLGQVDFLSNETGFGLGQLVTPRGLAVSGQRLWIADAMNGRLARHENAAFKSGAVAADGILGIDFGKNWYAGGADVAIDPLTGKLFLSDPSRNRVLRYASTQSLSQGDRPEAIFGQPNLTDAAGGTLIYKLNQPRGIHVDRRGNLWIADYGNNRVLRYANASTVSTGAAAAQVLGQVTFEHSVSGASERWMDGPTAIVTEYTTQPFNTTITRLWVADSGNNRILRFDAPLSLADGAFASGVLGQSTFTAGASALSAGGMDGPSGLAVDGTRLWVADANNHRILRFENAGAKVNGAAADGVLFQPGFTTKNSPGAPTHLTMGLGGRLFCACQNENRVLWFANAAQKANGAFADGALGQPDLVSTQPGKEATSLEMPAGMAMAPDGRLWVSEPAFVRRYTPQLESRIIEFGFSSQNRFSLIVLAHGGETYQIRSSTDLQDWSTIEVTQNVTGTGVQLIYWTASAPPDGPRKFYRLQVP